MNGLIFWDPDRARYKHLSSRRHDTSAGDMIESDLLYRQRPHEFMEARYSEAHQDGATILQRRHGDGRGNPPCTTDLSSERIVRHVGPGLAQGNGSSRHGQGSQG